MNWTHPRYLVLCLNHSPMMMDHLQATFGIMDTTPPCIIWLTYNTLVAITNEYAA
jgi:hypothetical protein